MDWNLSISILLTAGGMIASVASATAIVKTKVAALEKDLEDCKSKASANEIKLALLETNQNNFEKELTEVKTDIKDIKQTTQEIKETVLLLKKEAK